MTTTITIRKERVKTKAIKHPKKVDDIFPPSSFILPQPSVPSSPRVILSYFSHLKCLQFDWHTLIRFKEEVCTRFCRGQQLPAPSAVRDSVPMWGWGRALSSLIQGTARLSWRRRCPDPGHLFLSQWGWSRLTSSPSPFHSTLVKIWQGNLPYILAANSYSFDKGKVSPARLLSHCFSPRCVSSW